MFLDSHFSAKHPAMRCSLELSGTPEKKQSLKDGSCSWNKVKMWLYVHGPKKCLSINSTLGETIQDYVASLYIAKYFKQTRELAGREDGNLASIVQAIWSQQYLSCSDKA